MNEQEIILAELKSIRESVEMLLRNRDSPKAYSMAEAARLLSVSVRTIQRMVAMGQIQSVEVGARRLISAAEIETLTTPLPVYPPPRAHTPTPGGLPSSLKFRR